MEKLLFLFLIVLVACGGERVVSPGPTTSTALVPSPAPPTKEEAKEIVARSSEFSEFEFTNAALSLPLKRSLMNDPARAVTADLRKAGWIALDGSGTVALTSKSKRDKRFLMRPNGSLDIVPLAKKEMSEVTSMRSTSEGIEADFDWKWLANDVGSALRAGALHDRYAAQQHATATLIHDGTLWSVLRIKPQS